jgi:transcriptional regulator with XRE-family HTH domain
MLAVFRQQVREQAREIDGKRVCAAREGAFLSVSELAKKAQMDRNTVGRIEKGGTVRVQPRTIRKLAEALCVDPASLTPKNESTTFDARDDNDS